MSDDPDRPDKLFGFLDLKSGMIVWGFLLGIWLVAVILGLLSGICWPNNNVLWVIQSNQTVIAAITAVLGVVWSWFIQLHEKEKERRAEARRAELTALAEERDAKGRGSGR